jgi:hypothetical protein
MRRAFVMGSNGPANLSPLRYARRDAKRIGRSLRSPSCGFEIIEPGPRESISAVRQQLYTVVEACSGQDTFICYFSGHGFLEKGALFLLWRNTQLDRLLSTALPVSDIMYALRYCKAQNKLLILDCCHAGAVVNMTGLRDGAGTSVKDLEISPENHLVLMASDRLEKARELDEIQGGFLTTNICAALAEKLSQADKDGDNRISIHDLKQWLEERAKAHNRQFPDRTVPYPYLFGQQKGDFFLTIGASDWVPYELPWPDGSTMVVLPIRPTDGYALLIGKHPITNAQYRRFVEEGRGREPSGEHFIDSRWQGSFYPWREVEFSDPEQPVVCV